MSNFKREASAVSKYLKQKDKQWSETDTIRSHKAKTKGK